MSHEIPALGELRCPAQSSMTMHPDIRVRYALASAATDKRVAPEVKDLAEAETREREAKQAAAEAARRAAELEEKTQVLLSNLQILAKLANFKIFTPSSTIFA